MDRAAVQAWLDGYVAAWKSYDPAAIGDLFSEDAEYRYHPLEEPLQGRGAIVASWLEEPDEADTYDGYYEPALLESDSALATGLSSYFDAAGTMRDEYSNAFLIEFDEHGRCRRFTEWWRRSPRFARPVDAVDETTAVGDADAIGETAAGNEGANGG